MKNKESYLNALETLLNEYDAFYFANKYNTIETNTHGNEFKILMDLLNNDDLSMRALGWIKDCYDCYYKDEIINEDDTAFTYLRNKINEMFVGKNE